MVAREQSRLDELRARPVMRDPRTILDVRSAEVTELRERARRHLSHRLDRAADDIGHHRARAQSLSPLATLQRGYAVVQDAEGHVVTSVGSIAAKQKLSIRVVDGRINTQVLNTEEGDSDE